MKRIQSCKNKVIFLNHDFVHSEWLILTLLFSKLYRAFPSTVFLSYLLRSDAIVKWNYSVGNNAYTWCHKRHLRSIVSIVAFGDIGESQGILQRFVIFIISNARANFARSRRRCPLADVSRLNLGVERGNMT